MSIKEIIEKCKSPKVFGPIIAFLVLFAVIGTIRLSFLLHKKTPLIIRHSDATLN